MSHSEDEDDFQSADEDGFGDQHNTQQDPEPSHVIMDKPDPDRSVECDTQPLDAIDDAGQSKVKLVIRPLADKLKDVQDTSESEMQLDNVYKNEPEENDQNENDDEEEEEALAERIREKNLLLARKFSAEIAKNNKASAPIPVKTSAFKNSDIDCSGIPGSNRSGLPPAPPPTPALSSSFNNLEEPSTETTPIMKSQYSWRMKPKISTPTSQSETPVTSSRSETGDQARLALDRLSEKLSQSDKSILEQVAVDIKRVAIRGDDLDPKMGPALQSITDIGSTLCGWGWTGATKLLDSATQVTTQVTSQVTSQVGSVLDSVVNVSQNLQPRPDQTNSEREHDDL